MVTSLYMILLAILLTFLVLTAVEKLTTFAEKARKNKKGDVLTEQAPSVLVFDKQ